MSSIFEQASRRRLRFNTAIGPLAVEDLWDLPIVVDRKRPGVSPIDLNNIAIGLRRSIQDAEISFADDAPKVDSDLQLRFDVVRHIIDVKKDEATAARDAAAKAQRKQVLLGILSRKQQDELESLSVDDIKKLIDET
jgi:hypothetical protein